MLRRSVAGIAGVVSSIVGRVRDSTWTPALGKVGAIVVVLLVFPWIGRGRCSERAPPDGAMAAVDASAPVVPRAASAIDADAGVARSTEPPASSTTTTAATITTSRSRATPEDPVFLNDASVEELRRLPGVGPKRAEAILAHRRHLGRFSRVEDLLRVKGIGRGTLKKWRPLVRLDARAGPTAIDGGSGARAAQGA